MIGFKTAASARNSWSAVKRKLVASAIDNLAGDKAAGDATNAPKTPTKNKEAAVSETPKSSSKKTTASKTSEATLEDRLVYERRLANLQDRVEQLEGHHDQVARARTSPSNVTPVSSRRKDELVADLQRALADKAKVFQTTRDELRDAKITETEAQKIIDEQRGRIEALEVKLKKVDDYHVQSLAERNATIRTLRGQIQIQERTQETTMDELQTARRELRSATARDADKTKALIRKEAEVNKTKTDKLLEQQAKAHTEADEAKTRELVDIVKKLDESRQTMTQQMDAEIAKLKS